MVMPYCHVIPHQLVPSVWTRAPRRCSKRGSFSAPRRPELAGSLEALEQAPGPAQRAAVSRTDGPAPPTGSARSSDMRSEMDAEHLVSNGVKAL